jgi:hypothetical protein
LNKIIHIEVIPIILKTCLNSFTYKFYFWIRWIFNEKNIIIQHSIIFSSKVSKHYGTKLFIAPLIIQGFPILPKSVARCNIVWEISIWSTNQTKQNKQITAQVWTHWEIDWIFHPKPNFLQLFCLNKVQFVVPKP